MLVTDRDPVADPDRGLPLLRPAGYLGLGLWFVLTLMCATAWADTVTLKDGTVLEGEVKTLNGTKVVIEVRVGSSTATMSLARKDVASFQLGAAKTPARKRAKKATALPFERDTRARARKTPARKTGKTLEPGSGKLLILLDRSGSMAIGARWAQATEQVGRLVGRLRRTGRYDVIGFGSAARSLIGANTWLARKDWSPKRIRERLATVRPDLRSGTNLYPALRAAIARKPNRIVVISDGVVTRGSAETLERTRTLIAKAAEEGIRFDAVSVQDGRYHAPQVEDLPAARRLLSALARAGKGVFVPLPERPRPEPLPSTFTPVPGAPRATKRPKSTLAWLQLDSKKPIRSRELRPFPTFRLRVFDVGFLVGQPLDVWEYGGSVSYSVVIRDKGGLELTRADGLRLRRVGKFLDGVQAIRIVGPNDKSELKGRRAGRFCVVRALEGATVEVIYRRGNVKMIDRRVISVPPDLPYTGSP